MLHAYRTIPEPVVTFTGAMVVPLQLRLLRFYLKTLEKIDPERSAKNVFEFLNRPRLRVITDFEREALDSAEQEKLHTGIIEASWVSGF